MVEPLRSLPPVCRRGGERLRRWQR